MPDVAAFLTYVLVTTFTPGPNNIMSMANASRYGYRRSIRFTLGVGAGFFLIVALSIIFTITLYRAIPSVKPVMTVIGAAYILWLAYKVYTAKPPSGEDAPASNGFVSGMALQFLNPKAILYGLTAASTFIVPYYHVPSVLVAFAVFLALVSVVATNCWALFGSVFERFIGEHHRVVAIVMAGLLVFCAVSLFV